MGFVDIHRFMGVTHLSHDGVTPKCYLTPPIAADKMKMDNAHIVPLSTQAVALLRDIHPLSGNQQYVFASNQGKNGEKHISRESIGAAIRRMGYQGQHTAHGFRTTASTLYT